MSETRQKQRPSLLVTFMEYRLFPPNVHTFTALGLSSFLLLRLTVSETYLPPRKKLHWSQFGGFRKVEYVALQLGHLPVPLAVHFSFTADITYNAAKI